jgi:hypothetical protein
MDNSELLMRYNEVIDKCESILKECKKWKAHPDAVFRHGYAEEKAEKLLDNIRYTRDKLSESD